VSAQREPEVREIVARGWTVERHAVIDEVQLKNGVLRFRVRVADSGREPFLTRWFNDPRPAEDFLARLVNEGSAASA
jgi:hypothetical protein